MSRWNPDESSAVSWSAPATSASDPPSNGLKNGEKKRMESVFASSAWQPQQMAPFGKDQDGAPIASNYASLPSDASGQITWPIFQTSPGSLQVDSYPAANLYPSIDHTHVSSNINAASHFNATESTRSDQRLARDLESTPFDPPSASHSFRIPAAASQGFTIQYGRLAAATQREQNQVLGEGLSAATGRSSHSDKARRLDMPPLPNNAYELQEMYHSQSDVLEDLMRNSRAMQERLLNQNHHLLNQGAELDAEVGDMVGFAANPPSMQRANSALEPLAMPQRGVNSPFPMLEPYMPGWSSESVPAELPNHIVNRLRMSGQNPMLSGPPRPTSLAMLGALSGPRGQRFPMTGVLQNHQSLGLGDKDIATPLPDSPGADDLEELARNADAEIAHRAFLVPAHKKRGKGGRQPATDPRLDPNIDERKAKRILANRLSAARSKMKQKNQMEGFAKMVTQLEKYNKSCRNDAAELMETCEKLELQNRKLTGDLKILEEYHSRIRVADTSSANARPPMQRNTPASLQVAGVGHDNMDLFH